MSIPVSSMASPLAISSKPAESIFKTIADRKQLLPTDSLGPRIDSQVLLASAKASVAGMSPQKLNQYLDTSMFSQGESQAMMALFLSSVSYQEKQQSGPGEKDPVGALLSFDPGTWEKHVGVLVAAIVAINIARQSSAEMSGKFTQMAYEAAVSQGISIMAAGEAAMWAVVSGSVLSSTMSVVGAGYSVRGQNQKHTDVKTNKTDAVNYAADAQEKYRLLKTRPADSVASGTTRVTGTNSSGAPEVINLERGSSRLDRSDREVLSSQAREAAKKAADARMASLMQEKTYNRNLTIGGSVSSLAMMTSSALSAILRVREYAEREQEVLHQSEHNLNKAVVESANGSVQEDTALVGNILDAIQKLVDGRSQTMSAIASVRA